MALKYKAFVSYSHKDRQWARWLHRRLERYKIPGAKHSGRERTLKPIFFDRDELPAADSLGARIEEALSHSECLIIICSPHAAASKWVNQEILYFRQHRRDAPIFTVIVDSEPFISEGRERHVDECIPEALRFVVDNAGQITDIPADPLAADLRPGKDGKRLGVLKLISGMVNLGLDDLVQRDLKHARRRVTAITSGALATVLIMAGLTWTAMAARQEAEARTESAEQLIEFMVTDLKDKLEEVGRLDALKAVGEKAENYYDTYALNDHDDEALARRARVFHMLGEIENGLGNLDEAKSYFDRAFRATETLFWRAPQNPDRIFEHSQSAYWRAYIPWIEGDFARAHALMEKYAELTDLLISISPNDVRSLKESGYANTNLAILDFKLNKARAGQAALIKSRNSFEKLTRLESGNTQHVYDLADTIAWQSDLAMFSASLSESIKLRLEQFNLYQTLNSLPSGQENANLRLRILECQNALASLYIQAGKTHEASELLDESIDRAFALHNLESQSVRNKNVLLRLLMNKTELSLRLDERASLNQVMSKIKELISSVPPNNDDSKNIWLNWVLLCSKYKLFQSDMAIDKVIADGIPQSIQTKIFNCFDKKDLSNFCASFLTIEAIDENDIGKSRRAVEIFLGKMDSELRAEDLWYFYRAAANSDQMTLASSIQKTAEARGIKFPTKRNRK